MGAVKQMMYEEAETILGVTAQKLIGGDITEDDALEILDNNILKFLRVFLGCTSL